MPSKNFSAVLHYVSNAQLTFSEICVERDWDGDEEDCSPTTDAIIAMESEISEHLTSYGHSIDDVDVCIEFDDLLGCMEFEDEGAHYTYSALILIDLKTWFSKYQIQSHEKRGKPFYEVKKEELDRLKAIVENDFFQNYAFSSFELDSTTQIKEID